MSIGRIVAVGVGGLIGAILRYVLSGKVQEIIQPALFPLGTLTVNLMGCFIIGLLSYLVDTRSMFTVETRLFLITGILGGFTTFSTFSNETANMLREGQTMPAFINVAAHIILGLVGVWLGRVTAGLVWR